jgi:hypothetical protein
MRLSPSIVKKQPLKQNDMKLKSINLQEMEGFRFKNLDLIVGGQETCKGTCCPDDGSGCEDWEVDCPDQQ